MVSLGVNRIGMEATNPDQIASGGYDFVISSHVLEHVANPIQALWEWVRVLKDDGLFVLVVPHKDGTFDHRRPVTSLHHLIQDFDRKTTEADTTHLEEILALHDLRKDPEAGDFEAFRERSMKNLENRCLHHHVFDTRLAVESVHHVGLQLLSVELSLPYHIVILAQKQKANKETCNDPFRGSVSTPCWSSPFPSDQRNLSR